MKENPYTLNYFEILNILDLTDEEFDEDLIEFTLKYIRDKELSEKEDIAFNVLKELNEHNSNLLLEYINKYRTWGFDEDLKDYLIEKYYTKIERNY